LKPATPDPKFTPGFRLSFQDAIVLVAGGVSSITLGRTFWPASLIIAVALSQFFLFCNVFRIPRRPELIWAGIFVVLSGGTILVGFPGWVATLATCFCTTVVLVIREMKKPSYHGVAWQKINPHLRTWWNMNVVE
jgi:hypothetical protein